MNYYLPLFMAIVLLPLHNINANAYPPPCAANAGYIANNSTTPGLHTWTVGADLTDPSTNQEIVFSVVYYGNQPGPTFDYALMLVDASNKIVAYHTDSDPNFGNFDFSVLPAGAYRVVGLSYSQSNSPGDVGSYLQNLIALGYTSDLEAINLDSYITGGSFCMYYNSAPDEASSVYIASSTFAATGQVTRNDGTPLAGVTVQAGGDINTSAVTNAGGFYQFNGLPANGVYYLRADKMAESSPPAMPLSIADVLRLQDRIFGFPSFSSNCESITSDMNGSSALSTFDRVIMARHILGIPNNFRWNIVPAAVAAQSPDLGFNPYIETGQLAADGQYDFVAFWPGAFQNCGITPVYIPSALSLTPQILATPAYAGATIDVPIIAGQMDNIAGLQFSVQFDPAALTLTGVIKGSNFGNALTNAENAPNLALANANGSMGLVWTKPEIPNASYPAGEEICRLVFQVNGPAGNTEISISDIQTPAYTADDQYRLSPIIKNSGTLQILVCDPQPNLACFDPVSITLGPDCTAELTPALALDGDLGCLSYADFTVTVLDGNTSNGAIIDEPGTYNYQIELTGGAVPGINFSSCWGTVIASGSNSPSTGLNCANPTAGIGSATGTVNYDPGTGVFTLTSTGTMYNPSQDNVWMVPFQLCGDGEFYAEVTSVTNGFAGIMMREDLDANSKKVAILTNGGNSYRREIRMNKGDNATFANSPRLNPRWVRITRVGNVFTAYTSPDGNTWLYAFSVTIPMNSCIYAGMATFSNNQTQTVTATYDNVTLIDYIPLVALPVTFLEQQPFDVALFPNPSAGEVRIIWPHTAEAVSASLQITDNLGRLVYYQPHYFVDGEALALDLSNEPTGIYFFSVIADNKIVWRGKWVKR
ncbi:MAG: carboxypeptidase regulatory-like domain-containing protein [Saprospiraceae bacterium]|nr:carboxypeptidase regulatory-like domain-containing protein [Saprospiraceae bacterium]